MPKKFSMDWGKITDKIKQEREKKDYTDKRFYSPKIKEDGTFEATIRFLPSIDTDLPYVKYISHYFQTPNGKWFVDNCPTTLGNKCPVCEANGELWQTKVEANQKIASGRKQRTNFVSNILIVKDPQVPENNGKIFLYRYGVKIDEKIQNKIFPTDEDDKPIHVQDYYEGANFKLSIKMIKQPGDKKPMPNYDLSEFKVVSAIGEDDYIEKIRKETIPLAEFISPNNFKSYEELKIKFDKLYEGKGGVSEKVAEKTEAAQSTSIQEEPVKVETPPLNLTEDDDADFLRKLQE
jgi:hypothetical protein